jgi:SWI/SNF-related matrix-associated actin-dependent regulator of chromatin subfamily D
MSSCCLSKAVLGETKVNLEDVRQTEFYKQPWVKEAVFHYLTAKVINRHHQCLGRTYTLL